MWKLLRNILAVIVGWLAGIVVMFVFGGAIYVVGHFTSPAEFPFPPNENMVPTSIVFLLASVVMDFTMAVAIGYVITWIATKPAHICVYVAVALMLIGCVVTLFTADAGELPLWVSLARIVVAPVGLLLGAKLRGMGCGVAAPKPYDMREKNMAC